MGKICSLITLNFLILCTSGAGYKQILRQNKILILKYVFRRQGSFLLIFPTIILTFCQYCIAVQSVVCNLRRCGGCNVALATQWQRQILRTRIFVGVVEMRVLLYQAVINVKLFFYVEKLLFFVNIQYVQYIFSSPTGMVSSQQAVCCQHADIIQFFLVLLMCCFHLDLKQHQ